MPKLPHSSTILSGSPCAGGILRSVVVGVVFLGAVLTLAWMLLGRFAFERELAVRTGFPVEIERFYCNPFRGEIRANAISFGNPPGFPNSLFLRVSGLDLTIKPLSVRGEALEIPELSLVVDQLSLVVTETGQMNTRVFSDALDGPGTTGDGVSSGQTEKSFIIEHLLIEIQEVDIEDLSSGSVFVRRYRPAIRREFENVRDLDVVVRTLLGDLLQAGLEAYAPDVLTVIPARLAGPAGPVFLQGDERIKATMDSVIELLKNRFDSPAEEP
ncbi:MAG: hypothetical protein R3F07_04925 [Opitutaceae bacterium]